MEKQNDMNSMENFTPQQSEFMRMAIELSRLSMDNGGGPFGAVIVRNGKAIASGTNSVTLRNDPTAHAEVEAIRSACSVLGTFDLCGCEIYTSCEPCPMCLSAIYWAGIDRIYYASTRADASRAGFDDSFIYDQIPLTPSCRSIPSFPMEYLHPESVDVFRLWIAKPDKTEY